MNKTQILETLKLIRENSKKRNFAQSVDLIINLKGLDLKKPEQNINAFVTLPYFIGRERKIYAFVGDELQSKAKEVCDFTIHKKEFAKYTENLKELKKLAKKVDFFIAQANLMTDIAKFFGKTLGPTGKMPNPKAGAVIPPAMQDIKPLVEKLRKTVRVQTKNELSVKTIIGKENMSDEEISENILAVHNAVSHSVPDEAHNLGKAMIKLTMGKTFIIGQKLLEKSKEAKVSEVQQVKNDDAKKELKKIKKEKNKTKKEKGVKDGAN